MGYNINGFWSDEGEPDYNRLHKPPSGWRFLYFEEIIRGGDMYWSGLDVGWQYVGISINNTPKAMRSLYITRKVN